MRIIFIIQKNYDDTMVRDVDIEIRKVSAWDVEEISALYREGGWWNEDWDPFHLNNLIRGSFVFFLAIDLAAGRAVGMGRVISDGVSDAYIQDLVVHSAYRGIGIGRRLLNALIKECSLSGLTWVGLIAEEGTEDFYLSSGFYKMEGHIPMLFKLEGKDVVSE